VQAAGGLVLHQASVAAHDAEHNQHEEAKGARGDSGEAVPVSSASNFEPRTDCKHEEHGRLQNGVQRAQLLQSQVSFQQLIARQQQTDEASYEDGHSKPGIAQEVRALEAYLLKLCSVPVANIGLVTWCVLQPIELKEVEVDKGEEGLGKVQLVGTEFLVNQVEVDQHLPHLHDLPQSSCLPASNHQ